MPVPNTRNTVVLVDEMGAATGSASKIDAHLPPGRLHLAISVFLYRSDGALLLQRRAAGKYHFPGVWANSCCSHPRPGEPVAEAAAARVAEELGLRVDLDEAGAFVYRATCGRSGLVEHEYDTVFVGVTDREPVPDSGEVAEIRFVAPDSLTQGSFDGEIAPWLLPALEIAERARSVKSR